MVTACNNAELLTRCLDAVARSRFQDFELIVVDDASSDATVAAARRFTDNVIVFKEHRGVNQARIVGYAASRGDLVVNLDADVLVFPDTLDKIRSAFDSHPNADAVTGLLSKQHPFQDFPSQYKNLYMHYVFNHLPLCVTFLYGSLFAFRRGLTDAHVSDIRYGGDTLLGQKLWSEGKRIILDKTIQVVHLKKYDFVKLIRNDFYVPFYWASIFLRYQGIRQFGRNSTGFAHASVDQLAGIAFAALVVLSGVMTANSFLWGKYMFVCLAAWFFLSLRFFVFLYKERGAGFAAGAALFTFFDQLVMLTGIVAGMVHFLFLRSGPQSGQRRVSS